MNELGVPRGERVRQSKVGALWYVRDIKDTTPLTSLAFPLRYVAQRYIEVPGDYAAYVMGKAGLKGYVLWAEAGDFMVVTSLGASSPSVAEELVRYLKINADTRHKGYPPYKAVFFSGTTANTFLGPEFVWVHLRQQRRGLMYFTKWAYILTSKELKQEQAEEWHTKTQQGARPRKLHPVPSFHTMDSYHRYTENRIVNAFPFHAVGHNRPNSNTNNSPGNYRLPGPPEKRRRLLLKTHI